MLTSSMTADGFRNGSIGTLPTGSRKRPAWTMAVGKSRVRESERSSGAEAGRLEVVHPLGRRAALRAFREDRHERGEVSHAIAVGDEAWVPGELGPADHAHDALPVRLVGAADVDPAVAGRERLVGRGED